MGKRPSRPAGRQRFTAREVTELLCRILGWEPPGSTMVMEVQSKGRESAWSDPKKIARFRTTELRLLAWFVPIDEDPDHFFKRQRQFRAAVEAGEALPWLVLTENKPPRVEFKRAGSPTRASGLVKAKPVNGVGPRVVMLVRHRAMDRAMRRVNGGINRQPSVPRTRAGGRPRKLTDEALRQSIERFPKMPDARRADQLGVSVDTVARRLKYLGIRPLQQKQNPS